MTLYIWILERRHSFRLEVVKPLVSHSSYIDPVAQGIAGSRRPARHHVGQRLEVTLARNECVEHGIAEHRECQRHTSRGVPARALRRRRRGRPATIAASAVARETPRRAAAVTGCDPVPAHFDHRCLERRQCAAQRRGQTARRWRERRHQRSRAPGSAWRSGRQAASRSSRGAGWCRSVRRRSPAML